MKIFKLSIIFCFSMLIMNSCQQPGGDTTGSEFMPDMAHSTAYEANSYNYYYLNTWGTEQEYYDMSSPRLPVEGTVSRGAASNINIPSAVNSVSFDYENTEEERTRAMAEIIDNPIPITTKGLEEGKELYNIYCGICHGEKLDGGGYLVRDDGGKYPVQPANFLLDEHLQASNGRYYFAIMHGKNLMGSYADKVNYSERWNIIHYIRSLQAKELEKEYSADANTLDAHAIPGNTVAYNMEEPTEEMMEAHNETEEDNSGNH